MEFKWCYGFYHSSLFLVTHLAYLSKPPNSFPLCVNEVWKKGKPKRRINPKDSRSPAIQACKCSNVGCGTTRALCSAAGYTLQDLQNQAMNQHTQNSSPVTLPTRLMLRFYSSIQNNTFNVNTSSLMGSCPLSLRIWISWMRNLHCSQLRSLCCACRNTRAASAAYKCNRIVKLILSSPLFLLCLRACNPKSLWFSVELKTYIEAGLRVEWLVLLL